MNERKKLMKLRIYRKDVGRYFFPQEVAVLIVDLCLDLLLQQKILFSVPIAFINIHVNV